MINKNIKKSGYIRKEMKAGYIFGIIKFFHDENHLKELCAGKLYCNTPEYYRMNYKEGVADTNESISMSYRKNRGDEGIIFKIGGHQLHGIENLTFRGTGMKDRWLHCWTLIRIPADAEENEKLFNDISQMHRKFGPHYAYVLPEKIIPFIDRIRSLISLPVCGYEVKYSRDPLEWSPKCKSETFRYQREYRILIGECPENSKEPLVIEDKVGFHEFVQKDVRFSFCSKYNDNDSVFFELNGSNDIVYQNEIKPNSNAGPKTQP